ncbi:hypothetical protein [Brevundimonas sp.]|uniref:hypothetical protein n=1 Tax=Brevundimonas sp. TaxID=1871086 RepID=UPI002D5665ED|nr:hypothetical protein [Brevundimonas sp.]HYC69145.1 hypothetical protein [Brevundimonas sp.]
MLSPLLLSLALVSQPMQEARPQEAEPVTRLEDVVVDARALETMARDFIDDVAAPTRRRGLARWNRPLCVGVANLHRDVAQAVVDRISDVADALGVQTEAPGCEANVLIIAADDGAALARLMVERSPRRFDVGSLQMTQGDQALEEFQAAERPVRWWQISMPVNELGERAIRLAGDTNPRGGGPTAPKFHVSFASRIRSDIRDDLFRTIIIADIDDISGLSVQQVADYLAMVTLAQIDNDADSAGYDTVMNLFEAPDAVSGLTEWDMAYLRGLYTAEQNRLNPDSQAGVIARLLARDRRAAQTAETAAD